MLRYLDHFDSQEFVYGPFSWNVGAFIDRSELALADLLVLENKVLVDHLELEVILIGGHVLIIFSYRESR